MSYTEVTNKRAYKKAPIVIKRYLDKETKKVLMRFAKNHPRNIIKKVKMEERERKMEEKANKKHVKIEKKKAIHLNAKQRCEELTIIEKRGLIEKANIGLLNSIPNLTKSQKINIIDYLIQNTNNSVYVEMIKNGKLYEKNNYVQTIVSTINNKTKGNLENNAYIKLGTANENPKNMTMMMGNEMVNKDNTISDFDVIIFNE